MFRPIHKTKREVVPRVRIETLENRRLYSATFDLVAHPNVILSPDLTGGSSGYSPAQIRQAYGFGQVKFGSITGDGSGQTIAIVDAYNDPNIAADLHAFDQRFGLADPPSLRKVNESGGANLPSNDASWSLEISLDVEWAHAIAPKANILLVEASSASLGDLMSAVDTARHGAGVSTVSMSWGGSEFWGQAAYDSLFTTPAGHQGVTFVAAAGDNGSWFGPEWPASSSHVLGVGGTTLNVSNAAGTYQSETGWSNSGGGISSVVPEPSWQYRVQGTGARTSPDVAYDANTSSGFAVYDSVSYQGYSGWGVVGGTSAGTPQWAALVAIADQGRALNHLGSLDGATQTLPDLYSLTSSAFHDVTQGRSSFFFSSAPGYDAVTGLGTPKAQNIIAALSGATASSAASVAANAKTGSTSVKKAAMSSAAVQSAAAGAPVSPVPAARAIFADSTPIAAEVRSTSVSYSASNGGTVLAVINMTEARPPAEAQAGAPEGIARTFFAADAGVSSLGAIRTASGWLTAPSAPAALDSAAPQTHEPQIAYDFLRLDPAVLFNDATNALIQETASISAAGAASLEEHPWAWLVTAAVVTADAVLIARWQLARRRQRQIQAQQTGSPFSLTAIPSRE